MKYTIFLVFLLVFLRLDAHSVTEILNTIPKEDQEDLRYLFHIVFLEQDGAYTIFGDKPLSLAGDFLVASWEATIKGEAGKFGRVWQTWQNYKSKFSMHKYVIVSERRIFKKSDVIALHISVINKKAFIETISSNLSLFETILNRKINPEQFLYDIEIGESSLWSSINHNEMLLGILLGYGKHNSFHFNEKSQCSHFLFTSDHRELVPISSKLKCSDTETYPMMIINPVQYSADLDHPESKVLQKKYKNLRKKISDIYSQGDFLEITLSQLISG